MMVAMPNYNNLAGRDVAGLAFSLIFLECLRFVCVCVCGYGRGQLFRGEQGACQSRFKGTQFHASDV